MKIIYIYFSNVERSAFLGSIYQQFANYSAPALRFLKLTPSVLAVGGRGGGERGGDAVLLIIATLRSRT